MTESLDVPSSASRVPFGLSMLGWALNEEENVAQYIDRAGAFLAALTDDYELVLIDDGSTDRTWEIVDGAMRARPWLRGYRNDRNRGSGYNTKRAISLATKDYVFWQTVDWSYDVSNLRVFLELLKHYDVVQGIRPTPIRLFSYIPVIRSIYRVKTRSDNFRKAVISLSNYYLLRILFGAKDFPGVAAPSRLFTADVPLPPGDQSLVLRATARNGSGQPGAASVTIRHVTFTCTVPADWSSSGTWILRSP